MTQPVNNKRKLIGAVLLALVLAGVAAVVGYLHYRSTHVITDDAFVQGDIYYVSSQVPGKVGEVLIQDNQRVESGQVLVRIDPKDIEADLATARRTLEVVKNQVAAQYTQIQVVEAQIEQLRAQKQLLDKDKQRMTNLLRQHSASQEEYDRVDAQWRANEAQIRAAQRQIQQIQAAIGPQDGDGKVAAVRLAEAQVARLELNLDHTQIRAPVLGFITSKNVTVGQVVSPGQPLLAVVPLEGLWIEANYKETNLTHVRPGDPVVFKVDTYPGVKFHGEVESIMAGTGAVFSLLPPENATGNFIKVVQRIPVRIRILDGDAKKYPLRLGMSVVPVILVRG
jgi:membrane fusion protein (multidrug efflux system)